MFESALKYFSIAKLSNRLDDVICALRECYKELDDGSMNIGLCLEEVLSEDEPKKCKNSKYESCRKVYECTAKKLGLLDKEGKPVCTAMLKYKSKVDDDEEFDKVYNECKIVKGTGAEAVINTLRCILKTSNKARKNVDELMPYLKNNFKCYSE